MMNPGPMPPQGLPPMPMPPEAAGIPPELMGPMGPPPPAQPDPSQILPQLFPSTDPSAAMDMVHQFLASLGEGDQADMDMLGQAQAAAKAPALDALQQAMTATDPEPQAAFGEGPESPSYG